jgi:hypothetical protein
MRLVQTRFLPLESGNRRCTIRDGKGDFSGEELIFESKAGRVVTVNAR